MMTAVVRRRTTSQFASWSSDPEGEDDGSRVGYWVGYGKNRDGGSCRNDVCDVAARGRDSVTM